MNVFSSDPTDTQALYYRLLELWYIPAVLVSLLLSAAIFFSFRKQRRTSFKFVILGCCVSASFLGLRELRREAWINLLSSEDDRASARAYEKLGSLRSLNWAFRAVESTSESDNCRFYAALRLRAGLKNGELEEKQIDAGKLSQIKIRPSFFQTNKLNADFYETCIVRSISIYEIIRTDK
jgi:hypothetical protein